MTIWKQFCESPKCQRRGTQYGDSWGQCPNPEPIVAEHFADVLKSADIVLETESFPALVSFWWDFAIREIDEPLLGCLIFEAPHLLPVELKQEHLDAFDFLAKWNQQHKRMTGAKDEGCTCYDAVLDEDNYPNYRREHNEECGEECIENQTEYGLIQFV